MKQLKLLSALLMCLLALNFTACGGEEDEEIIDPGPQPEAFDVEDLYGGWKYEVGNECLLFYFSDEDNTGILVEKANSDNYDRCDITYKVNGSVTTITITEEDGDKEKYTILSLTNKKLVIEDAYEDVYTFKRYNGDIDEEYPKLKYDIKNLYGGWEYESDYDCCLYYFSPEDNTGILVENPYSNNYDRCDITYKLNSSLTVLTITEEDGDKEKYTIVSLTSKKLVLEDEYGDTYTLKRYNGNIDEEYPDNDSPSPVTNSLIGIWKHTFSSGASYVVFKNDGTCETFEIDLKDGYNAIEDIEAVPYTYNSTTKQLCLYEDGDEYYYSVKSLTTNNMTIVDSDGEIENWVKYNGTLEDIAAEYGCIFYYDTDEYEEENMLFETPYLQWGSTPSTVKNRMSSKGYSLLAEDGELLYYYGKYREDASAYAFDESSLYAALILLDASKYTFDNVLEHIDDVESGWNYMMMDEDGSCYFRKDDNSTHLCVTLEDGNWMLAYVSASDFKTASARAKAIGKRVR